MPHCFCIVMVPKDSLDIKAKVAALLAPWETNLDADTYSPMFKWYTWEIGGRYNGLIRHELEVTRKDGETKVG